MREKEAYNDWAGFDSDMHVYDERKEKWYQATIWWCLGVIALVISVSLIVREIKDYYITRTYQCVRAELRDDKGYAVYLVEDVTRLYYLSSHSVKTDGNYVLLYYKNDIEYAEAVPTLASWLPHQIFFAALTLFSGWKLWTIYKGKKHSEEV